jgi:hypothetical protein
MSRFPHYLDNELMDVPYSSEEANNLTLDEPWPWGLTACALEFPRKAVHQIYLFMVC